MSSKTLKGEKAHPMTIPTDWISRAFEEAKTHLEPEKKIDYVMRRDTLDDITVKKIEGHLKECARCRGEVSSFEGRKEFYLSTGLYD